jgi:putative transposase
MPRTARNIVGDHCYHVINRGNGGARMFHQDSDYAAFIAILNEAHDEFAVPTLAACLMPNHIHLVVRPVGDGDLSRWTQRVFTTHVRRYHATFNTSGRIWQGRFKAFLIQQDAHLLTVMRYVERNALRADLVSRAEHWKWGSLSWRAVEPGPVALAESPVTLPNDWVEYVNKPQTPAEVESIRVCINRQRPFGSAKWVYRKVRELGLESSLSPLGRPATARQGNPARSNPKSKR